MRSASSWSSRPRWALTRAAVALMRPSQRITGTGIGLAETGKFATALVVSPPQSSRRSSVALMHRNLALCEPRPAAARVGDSARCRDVGLRLQPSHQLVGPAAAARAALGGADQVAQLQRGLRVAGTSAVAQPLR